MYVSQHRKIIKEANKNLFKWDVFKNYKQITEKVLHNFI